MKLKLCDPKAPGADDATDVDGWIDDSFALAKLNAYARPVGGTTATAFRLDEKYRTDAARVARSQVALGGARLAKLLDEGLQP